MKTKTLILSSLLLVILFCFTSGITSSNLKAAATFRIAKSERNVFWIPKSSGENNLVKNGDAVMETI